MSTASATGCTTSQLGYTFTFSGAASIVSASVASSDPTLLPRVTGLSCDYPGFMAWQRCIPHSLLLAKLGWLPDLNPEPEPEVAATTPDRDRLRVLDATSDAWDIVLAPAPSEPLTLPTAKGRADGSEIRTNHV